MLPLEPDSWTLDLANAQRLEAIAAFGFTERQAGFLLHVLLHSGVFVERQYCSFASIGHGQKSTDFLKALVDRRFATPISTGKLHRGRMFHVHYKPLWAAIGEPDNRFRKPTALGRMVERVMLLDAVLDDRQCVWLGPSTDKRRHFTLKLETVVEVSADPTSQSHHSLTLSGSPPHGKLLSPFERRDVRVVEGARLESVCTRNRTKGSNPFLSANLARSIPDTWVTLYSGDMGNTFG